MTESPDPSPPLPRAKCRSKTQAGKRCPRPGTYSDGCCVGHSTSPEALLVQARAAHAGTQEALARVQRRVPGSTGQPKPRADAEEERRPDATWPAALDLADVACQLAWREAAVRNLIAGAISTEDARVLSTLLSGASTAKRPEGAEGVSDSAEGRLSAELLGRLTGGT